MQPIFATITAASVWGDIDTRIAEAGADSLGFDTPLRWELAIKTHTLLMLVGVIVLVTGFSLGDIADEAITWVSNYDDDTKTEGDDKTDGTVDADGTSAQQDILLHLVTAVYGMFLFGVMSLSSFIFAWSFLKVKTDGEDFECDINAVGDKSGYSQLQALFETVNDKQSCLDGVEKVFKVLDLNGDHLLSRCEDTAF